MRSGTITGMKRLAIGLAALVLIPCAAVLWFVWSASSPGPDEAGLAAVSAGISEALVEAFLAVLVVALCWWGWMVGRRHWRKSRIAR